MEKKCNEQREKPLNLRIHNLFLQPKPAQASINRQSESVTSPRVQPRGWGQIWDSAHCHWTKCKTNSQQSYLDSCPSSQAAENQSRSVLISDRTESLNRLWVCDATDLNYLEPCTKWCPGLAVKSKRRKKKIKFCILSMEVENGRSCDYFLNAAFHYLNTTQLVF